MYLNPKEIIECLDAFQEMWFVRSSSQSKANRVLIPSNGDALVDGSIRQCRVDGSQGEHQALLSHREAKDERQWS